MTESPWDVALRAADVLAPESTALSNPDDVAQLGDALVSVIRQAVGDPAHVFNVGLNLAVALAQVPPKTLTHWLGDADTVPPGLDPKDRRFSDPAWNGNPFFVALRLAHAAASRSVLELIDPPGAEQANGQKGADAHRPPARRVRARPTSWRPIRQRSNVPSKPADAVC